jgi:hypothetical protein
MKTIYVSDQNRIPPRLSPGDIVMMISENGESVYLTAEKSYGLCDGCVFRDHHSEAFRTMGSCSNLRIPCLGIIFVDTRAIMEEL